jgi:hypothetical protein
MKLGVRLLIMFCVELPHESADLRKMQKNVKKVHFGLENKKRTNYTPV